MRLTRRCRPSPSSPAAPSRSSAGRTDQPVRRLPGPTVSGVERDVQKGHLLQRPGHPQAAGVDRPVTQRGRQLGDLVLGCLVVAGVERVQGRTILARVAQSGSEDGVEGLDDRRLRARPGPAARPRTCRCRSGRYSSARIATPRIAGLTSIAAVMSGQWPGARQDRGQSRSRALTASGENSWSTRRRVRPTVAASSPKAPR